MSNIVQVVEVTPTPSGQWVTFWHAASRQRISGEFKSTAYETSFDRGDLYVCLTLDTEAMSIVGPHPVDLLTTREFASLPIVADQNVYSRHDRYKRFDLDRNTAVLSRVGLSEEFKKAVSGKTPEETLKEIARLH